MGKSLCILVFLLRNKGSLPPGEEESLSSGNPGEESCDNETPPSYGSFRTSRFGELKGGEVININ